MRRNQPACPERKRATPHSDLRSDFSKLCALDRAGKTDEDGKVDARSLTLLIQRRTVAPSKQRLLTM